MEEVEVLGVRIELPANQPVLLLKANSKAVFLPIWIGTPEANSIALALQGFEPPRPLTHQLLLNVLDTYGAKIERVEVTGRERHTYISTIVLTDGNVIDARPSDAVTLALLESAAVYVEEGLLEAGGVRIEGEDEEEVAQFREFLDHVSAEDFDPDELMNSDEPTNPDAPNPDAPTNPEAPNTTDEPIDTAQPNNPGGTLDETPADDEPGEDGDESPAGGDGDGGRR